MNPQAKNKWLITAILLLLLANLATLTVFWLGRAKKHPGQPQRGAAAEYIIKETGFDKKQEEEYRNLIKEHQKAVSGLREEIRQAKDRLFDLAGQESVSDSLKKALANEASRKTAELDLLTLEHFQKVKAICRPDQRSAFERIIHEALRMMGPQQGGERPGPPPGGPPNGSPGEPPPPENR